jgi:hypothetical protein
MDLFILVVVPLMLFYRRYRSRNIVVGIVIWLGTGRFGLGMPVGAKDFSLPLNV